MTSKTVAQLLTDLDVGQSHSRPQVSNHNPFSESQFTMLKSRSSFPGKFVDAADAVAFSLRFFAWCTDEHRHSGIEYLTPRGVDDKRDDEVLIAPYEVKLGALRAQSERFVGGEPRQQTIAAAVSINPPALSSSPPSSSSSP
jgi:putative transposase